MKTSHVTVSSKYQIVLPEEFRVSMKITPGQKIALMREGNTITLIPVRPLKEMRGIIKGSDVNFDKIRDKKDRRL